MEENKFFRERTLNHKFFKTQRHFVNFTLKLLKELDINHNFISTKNISLLGWYLSKENIFVRNEIKLDINKFTWSLKEKEVEVILSYLDNFNKIIDEIEKLKNKKIQINECIICKEIFPFYDEIEIFEEKSKNKKLYLEDLQKYDKVPGIYFLYDKNKKLIYIGKSYNLRIRVEQSIMDKKAFYYKLLATENSCEANILEPYYIAIYSPELNFDFVTYDKPSFEINHKYIKSKMYKVFNQPILTN